MGNAGANAFAATKRTRSSAARLGARAVDGQLLTTSTPTVAQYLEDWFATNTRRLAPKHAPRVSRAIDLYLVPAFGPLRLEQLTPQPIQRWLRQHKRARRPAADRARACVLRSALSDAQRLQLVTINAAELVKVPKPKSTPITPLTSTQATTFLKVGRHASARRAIHRRARVRVAARRSHGPAMGDVDLEPGKVRVRQQLQSSGKRLVLQPLKTEKSRRTLTLPAVCLDALRAHRTRQLEERLKAGPDWIETGLVFTTYATAAKGGKIGRPLHPRNVLRILHHLLEKPAAARPLPRSATLAPRAS